ncbi:S16 family serine protease [Vibrio cincinnatiensis]|uniref:S16 family serine protease n=1 Tax=Vibrio cincinnatiensis TaxID=675 RepID=UPI001EDF7461|nr:Lon protease family protein [Vibrio cincinnatiensis]MCG3725682.1 Lon protease family protein [Vibrio cincinnatiensis]MCG3732537.1 Lon protease family protein [Vibrio cincinnatiensis]MCG3735515.1 Lon protease family protein [Vibrio cincinnatiensis]MCG3740489.1 Lon protease family protein [Vibrio cincinnatiensis]MCG3742855.1 Lon protease family protein [Vibrio cincinnatiensis]
MTQDIWRLVTPQYDDFDLLFAQFEQAPVYSFFQTQHRLSQAIERFIQIQGFSRVLLINAPDNSIYRSLIQEQIQNKQPQVPVIRTETLDMPVLFGQIKADENGQVITQTSGLLEQAHNGYLIVSANLLLTNPRCWSQLKSALLGENISPINCDKRSLLSSLPHQSYNIKLIIVGDRHQLGDIDFLDADIHAGLCLFSELELDIKIDHSTIPLYLGYLRWIVERYHLPLLTKEAIEAVMTAGARYTEDQHYAPLCLMWHRALLEEAAIESQGNIIEQSHVIQVVESRYYRSSYLPERALDDILDGQVIIETQGQQVGQVNGLTVIDVAGHPISYGEPARISCVIHFGDGDIADVERKVELGGNLHAKGMMIMQAFVSSALDLDVPLPFSASVVFEQSYSEVDGDSASLAELCSLVSALSEYPIDQQIAVTGAVDQFGRVQAVGGLNEKIEGFYRVCQHQGFTGQQGVILPKSNLKHLALHPQVVESIKNGQFSIWPVSTVDEAIPILMSKPFRGDDDESVISKIADRIAYFEKNIQPHGLLERIKNWFV